ncbi:diguanylate cyclase [Thioalkalivibrio sp. ARh3]|uniref:GGDEF domain-containing protein n=1 Tax=Thioalkalivibrio sp. ARh3 TaxID=1158148 RepID=UPI000366A9F0|nr:GGDEF domain-containing protein [Thioalkalivibrio sp. ARh3]
MSGGRPTLIEGLKQQLGSPNRDLLLMPWRHHALLEHQRARLIISRVRLVAFLFALLTPLWILVDLVFLPWPVWGELALARLLTSAAFLAMALRFRPSESMPRAWVALALLFAIPTVFFLYSHPLLAFRDMAGLEAAIAAGYAFLPFVMIAGLAIFPLTVTEAVAYAAPVLAGQAVAAALQLDGMEWTTHAGAFWLLLLIASVAALASMSQLQFLAALVRESSRDALTGCYTRRSGESLLEREMARSQRQSRPLAVAFVDLDNFKALNDRFGHEQGDRALRAVATALTERLRGIDSVIRWGGEEFLVLMPETDRAGAREAMERVLREPACYTPDGDPLTASTGIASYPEETLATGAEALVHEADLRMYRAKKEGGDRIIDTRVTAQENAG